MNNTIYVLIMNHWGDKTELAKKFGATVCEIDENVIVFKDKSGPEVSDLMEKNGLDYNYSYSLKDVYDME